LISKIICYFPGRPVIFFASISIQNKKGVVSVTL
jgi:hypothetical protein